MLAGKVVQTEKPTADYTTSAAGDEINSKVSRAFVSCDEGGTGFSYPSVE